MDFTQMGAESCVFIPERGVPILVLTLLSQPQDCFIFIFALSPPSSSYTSDVEADCFHRNSVHADVIGSSSACEHWAGFHRQAVRVVLLRVVCVAALVIPEGME
jgi:hypothetical protein